MQAERSAARSRRAYGSGSIIERRGDFYGKWRIGDRQVMRKLGPIRSRGESDGLTRREAEARLRELMSEVRPEDVGKLPAPEGHSIADLAALYFEHARERKGLKETTLSDYEMTVRVHLSPFFGATPVERIDGRKIEALVSHLLTKKGDGRRGRQRLAPKTVENYVRTLSALLNFAVRLKWIPSSPMLAADLPRLRDTDAPIKELRFLMPEEVAALIEAARPGRYHLLDRALYAVATSTGLRQGELRGLRWGQVDFGQRLVHVLEGVTRGRTSSPKGKRRRSVPLPQMAARALLELYAETSWTGADEYVFACPSTGKPMHRGQLMSRYRAALGAAGLSTAYTFHELRHTFGTTMARAGTPVGTIQAWMGHADLTTTQIYMHHAPRGADADLIDAAFGVSALSTNLATKLRVLDGTEGNSEEATAA